MCVLFYINNSLQNRGRKKSKGKNKIWRHFIFNISLLKISIVTFKEGNQTKRTTNRLIKSWYVHLLFCYWIIYLKNYRFHCLSLIISFTPTVYCTASYRTEWFERKLVLYLFFWKTIKPGYNLTIVPYISRYLNIKLTYNVNSLNPSSEDRKWLPTKWTTLNSFSIKSLYM